MLSNLYSLASIEATGTKKNEVKEIILNIFNIEKLIQLNNNKLFKKKLFFSLKIYFMGAFWVQPLLGVICY